MNSNSTDWINEARSIENKYTRKAKEEGQKMLGYICLATPKEIMEAAGVFPYRIKALGNPNTDVADAYLSRFNCGFCRSVLQLGLDGTFDFLDGIIETNGCDHLRGMFENWQRINPRPFFHYVKVPHMLDDEALDWFTEELGLFKEALEELTGKKFGDKEIEAAMETRGEALQELKRINQMRWDNNLRLTGSEFMSLISLEGAMPSAEFRDFLRTLYKEIEAREPFEYRARLFMGGSATDEIDIISELEELGGIVVGDSFCYGGRLFAEDFTADAPKLPESDSTPLSKLAWSYLRQLLCPRIMNDYPRRRNFIISMMEKSRADGIILFHNKFCDLHGVENVQLRMDMEKRGIPVLLLEKEYGAKADIGRFKTRVQAFMEQIRK